MNVTAKTRRDEETKGVIPAKAGIQKEPDIDYNQVIERNLAELSNAILERRALAGLDDANSSHSLDFFRIASHALYNDMISHALKVFDENRKDATSFWFIERVYGQEVDRIATSNFVDIKKIRGVSERLKPIRNKTHFHIDLKWIKNPKEELWDKAGIKGEEFLYILEKGYCILSDLYEEKTGKLKSVPNYDGSDVPEIIRAYKKGHPEVPIAIQTD